MPGSGHEVSLATRVRIRGRVASARYVRLRPTFLVVGAQKAGTTALHHYLQAHGAVLCARIKEVNYFDNSYWLGDRWYLAHFPVVWHRIPVRRRWSVDPAVGELSPSYLLDPRVPERVRAFDPSLQLVALLRDPVDRAYSHYLHERRRGRESLSFAEALEREDERIGPALERMLSEPNYVSSAFRNQSYLARGRYAEQLERWLEHFPRDQLLVLQSSDLRRDPRGSVAELSAFLGIPHSRAASYPEIGLTSYPVALEPATREWLARYFEPHNRRLGELLGRELRWTRPGEVENAVRVG